MNAQFRSLLVDQLSARLKDLDRPELREPPAKGWIRSLRESLSMSAGQLAKRVGAAQPNITKWEQRELDGTITLKSLRRIAAALQCNLVYALVPQKPIDQILADRAQQIAATALQQVNRTMQLEDQATSAAQRTRQAQKLVRCLLEETPQRLWDA
jgi:predicted DNA-binding mobile mystery protein A